MYLRTITIDVNDFTPFCRKESTEIRIASNGRMSTARLEAVFNPLASPPPAIPLAQDEISIKGNKFASPAQVLTNHDFAAGGTGWTAIGTVVYTGGQAKVQAPGASASARVLQRVRNVVPGQVVTLRSRIFTNSNGEHYLVLAFFKPNGDFISQATQLVTITGGFQTATLTATVPDGAEIVDVSPAGIFNGTTGTCDCDWAEFEVGDVTLFSGRVTRVEPTVVSSSTVVYSIASQDDNRVLDTTIIPQESYSSQNDSAIIADLISTYGGVTAGTIQTIKNLPSIEFVNLSFRACLDRIAERTGAEWRVDFDGKLHYYAVGAIDGLFDFSDTPNGTSTDYYLQSDFGYQEDFSSPANSVTVSGFHPPQGPDVTTTFLRPNASDSGTTSRVDTVWPPIANPSVDTVGEPYFLLYKATSAPVYSYGQFLVRFNTASIPDDAEVLSADLILTVRRSTTTIDENAMYIGGQYYSFSTIASTDYISTGLPNANAFAYRPTKPFAAGVYEQVTFPLSNLSNINKTGFTGFRIALDKWTSGAFPNVLIPGPGVDQDMRIAEATTPTDRRPVLRVTYRPARAARITGSHTDAASVAAYGVFERTITDESIKTTGEAALRAEVETRRFGYPVRSINVTFDRDGLRVGDTVTFNSSLLGISSAYVVKSLRLRWPARQDVTRYTAELGEFRPDLIQFLRKRA